MAKRKQDKPKERRKCHGTKADGSSCGAQPMKPGTEIHGVKVSGKWCRVHDEDLPSSAKLTEVRRASGRLGGRPKNPTIPTVMKRVIEDNIEHMLKPYAAAIGMKIQRPTTNGDLVMVPDPDSKGATLFGESKDGEIVMTEYPDLEAQQKAAERMLDRVYGRPKQATELSFGGGDEEDPPEVPKDDERALEVALILKTSGGAPSLNVSATSNGTSNGDAHE